MIATTDRGRLLALRQLVEHQESGGYVLPEPLVSAYRLPDRLRELPVPVPASEPFDREQAADQIVWALQSGQSVDLLEVATRVQEQGRLSALRVEAVEVLDRAAELARVAALSLATDRAQSVLVEVLQPAHRALLEEAHGLTQVLDGQPMDPRSLLLAPQKVRSAFTRLQDMGTRHRVLRQARS